MRTLMSSLAAVFFVAALGTAGGIGSAMAQGQAHVGPSAMLNEHRVIERNLTWISHGHGRVAAAAQKALALIVPHQRREEEFVLPLLGLVDSIVDHGVTPDMAWAVDMANRVKAESKSFYDEHAKLVAALDDLAATARRQHDRRIVAFCEAVAAHATADNEVVIPTAILVGLQVADKLGSKG